MDFHPILPHLQGAGVIGFNLNFIAAVAQWLRLEIRCDRSQVRYRLYMRFRFGRNLAHHHANLLALSWS